MKRLLIAAVALTVALGVGPSTARAPYPSPSQIGEPTPPIMYRWYGAGSCPVVTYASSTRGAMYTTWLYDNLDWYVLCPAPVQPTRTERVYV